MAAVPSVASSTEWPLRSSALRSMARSSFLSSTRRRGSMGRLKKSAGPAGIPTAGAQLVFHVAELLLQIGNLFLLGLDLGGFLVDFGASVLFVHGLLRIGIILNIGLLQFALKNVAFEFSDGDFLALFGGSFARGFVRVGIFACGCCGIRGCRVLYF